MGGLKDDAKRLGEEIQQTVDESIRAELAKATPDPEKLKVSYNLKVAIGDDPEGFVFKAMDEMRREEQKKEDAWWAKWGFLTGWWTFYLGLAIGLLRPWNWLDGQVPFIGTVLKWALGLFVVLFALLTIERVLEDFKAKRSARKEGRG